MKKVFFVIVLAVSTVVIMTACTANLDDVVYEEINSIDNGEIDDDEI